jgi:hypothetical protein
MLLADRRRDFKRMRRRLHHAEGGERLERHPDRRRRRHGGGVRLLDGLDLIHLNLLGTTRFTSGIVVHTYGLK